MIIYSTIFSINIIIVTTLKQKKLILVLFYIFYFNSIYISITMNSVITQINQQLFLGKLESNNIDIINQYDISLIISFISDEEEQELKSIITDNEPTPRSSNIVNLIYNIDDDPSNANTMKMHLDNMYSYVEEYLNDDKKILIQCSAGHSRSPTAIIYILMKYYELSLSQAHKLVLYKRDIEPNFGFWMVLVKYNTHGVL